MPRIRFTVRPDVRKVKVTTEGPSRLRFTLGEMMRAVAVLAFLTCLVGLPWVNRHKPKIAYHLGLVSWLEGELRYIAEPPEGPHFAHHKPMKAKYERLIDYHQRMAAKYERANRYPWLSVEPDPPEPQ
jgi:hypothetical protein